MVFVVKGTPLVLLACLNGHLISSKVFESLLGEAAKHCSRCGAKTIYRCEKCDKFIQGSVFIGDSEYKPVGDVPSYCIECGQPFPWTVSRIAAALDLAREMDELTAEQREILAENVTDLASDTPKTTVAATRIWKVLRTTGAETLRKLLVEISAEAAKRIIMGGP